MTMIYMSMTFKIKGIKGHLRRDAYISNNKNKNLTHYEKFERHRLI